MWRSFDLSQYCIDRSELVDILCERLRHGKVKGRLILDKSMFFRTTPWRQPNKVRALREAGCKIRLRQPPEGKYAYMHMKCCLCDGRVLFTGSVNLTHNGLEYSDEHLVRIEEAGEIAKYQEHYERIWNQSQILRQGDLDEALRLRVKAGNEGDAYEDDARWS
jgi:phosphatidylserine/phosphatidylglycerophosphate/cardiolipin synthase-like enzyme